MLAKLIVHDTHRAAAARRLAAACAAVQVWPVRTNAAFLARVAADPAFVAGDVDTGFIERRAATLIPDAEPAGGIVQAAAQALLHQALPESSGDPWERLPGFRAGAAPQLEVAVAIGDAIHVTTVDPAAPRPAVIVQDGERVLFWRGEAWRFGVPTSERSAGGGAVADGALRSPMPGRIVNVSVRQGEAVTKGQTLLALEAMKMEHAMLAPFDGVVAELTVAEGDQVAENVVLVCIEHSGSA